MFRPSHGQWVKELLIGCRAYAVVGIQQRGIMMGSIRPDISHRPFHYLTRGVVPVPETREGVKDGTNHIVYIDAEQLYAAGAEMWLSRNGVILTRDP